MTQRKVDNGQPPSFMALLLIAIFIIMGIIGLVVIAIALANSMGLTTAIQILI